MDHMSSQDRPEALKQIFPFLQLSAELRNYIYGLAAHGEGQLLKISRSYDGVGTYAGLTRVNKQIREEYMPIQRREAMVEIQSNDLAAFLSVFLPPSANEANAPKSLRIVVGESGTTNWRKSNVDLLPLVRSQHKYPEMNCDFHMTKAKGPMDGPQALMELVMYEVMVLDLGHILHHDNARWKADIANGTIQRLFFKGMGLVVDRHRGQRREYGIGAPWSYFKYIRTWSPEDEEEMERNLS